MKLAKAHAFGNDFLLLREDEVPAGTDRPALARELCARHRGIDPAASAQPSVSPSCQAFFISQPEKVTWTVIVYSCIDNVQENNS